MSKSHRHAFTLIELLFVVVVLGAVVSVLMLGLSRVRKSTLAAKLARESGPQAVLENPGLTEKVGTTGRPTAPHPRARVKTFEADVELTPRLSIGTAEPGVDLRGQVWDYKRLLFGQPIRLDVLGIAPIDRLGELTWLGPVSVVVFGLLLGLAVHSAGVGEFDRWMLLLTLGTFAAAYPLMYFAQEFISLEAAVLTSAALMLAIIGARCLTILGPWLTIAAVVLPAAAVLAITLVAAIWPRLQGILLTCEALGYFVAAMMLIPRLQPAPAAAPDAAIPGPA